VLSAISVLMAFLLPAYNGASVPIYSLDEQRKLSCAVGVSSRYKLSVYCTVGRKYTQSIPPEKEQESQSSFSVSAYPESLFVEQWHSLVQRTQQNDFSP